MRIKFLIIIFLLLNNSFCNVSDEKITNPIIALGLSAVIPGGGQIYNGNLHKTFFINSALCLSYIEMNLKNKSLDKRNTWAWWILGIYTFGLVDAYVDAHLTSFPKEKKNSIE